MGAVEAAASRGVRLDAVMAAAMASYGTRSFGCNRAGEGNRKLGSPSSGRLAARAREKEREIEIEIRSLQRTICVLELAVSECMQARS